jgi:hypothetical protein
MRDPLTNWIIPDNKPSGTWDALSAWDAWTHWPSDPYTTITYEENPIDLGAEFSFSLVVSVLVDGAATVRESHSSDGVTYSSWATPSGAITARYVKVKVSVTGAFPILKDLQIHAIGKQKQQSIIGLDTSTVTGAARIGVGDIRLPAAGFTAIQTVSVTFLNVGGKWGWELVDKTTSGPRIKIYNASGALADAVIDAVIQGY